jgi:hypothetical protein
MGGRDTDREVGDEVSKFNDGELVAVVLGFGKLSKHRAY